MNFNLTPYKTIRFYTGYLFLIYSGVGRFKPDKVGNYFRPLQSLLIEAIGLGLKTIYGLRRNGALVTTLRNALDDNIHSEFNDLGGLVYFINNPRRRDGIAEKNFTIHDIDMIICDEAQRMLKDSISVLPGRAPVIVYFVDETQRLNFDEQGVEENFQTGSVNAGAKFKRLNDLPSGIRCRGGKPYHEFVETLLEKPIEISKLAVLQNKWSKSYDFKVFDKFPDFLTALKKCRDLKKSKVALVASWTESDGDTKWRLNNRPNGPLKNIRIGPSLQSDQKIYHNEIENIFWVMNPGDYRQFEMSTSKWRKSQDIRHFVSLVKKKATKLYVSND